MKRTSLILQGLVVWACLIGRAMAFEPPTLAERLKAIGATEALPQQLRVALEPGDFQPISPPGPGDWLAMHLEPGQTFEEFVRLSPPRPRGSYLQPLGDFPVDKGPLLDLLKGYAAAYFSLEVKVLSPLPIGGTEITSRRNPITGHRQILTGDVLELIKKGFPRDAFCVLAITMEDLYPHPSWNFVFGQASLRDGVGVFSLARYDPVFYGETRGEGHSMLLLRRSCRVLVHETAHMFSLAHCVFFRCVMNGSNHLDESDARPLHICPVCLRKLHFSLGFDVQDRYERLLGFYRQVGFHEEARWVAGRLERISGGGK